MSDYTGLAIGAVICVSVLIGFEIANRRARRRATKDDASASSSAESPSLKTR